MTVTTHDIQPVGRTLTHSLWGGRFPASERIDLLEAIDQAGSISRAARRLDMSYKTAWDAVDAINNLAEKPMLIRAPGGPHGCGSYLTEYGREFVRLYRLLEAGYRRLLTQMRTEVGDFDELNELLKAMTMKTSVRNRLEGVVSAVIPGSVNSEVKIQLVGGRTLTAIVTCEALKELDLADGSSCCALVKASHVLIAVNG